MNSKRLFVNALTFARVPLIFAWLVLAIVQEFTRGFWLAWIAGALMFLAGMTDMFDGRLARKWNVVSSLGKMADPLMDKVFYVMTFPALTWFVAHQGESDTHALVLLAFTILYILRDLWVTFMRSVGSLYGADVSAMWLGKLRTALSFPAAGWIYAYTALHLSGLVNAYLPMESLWRDAWLWSCYAVEGFMTLLNVVSCVSYTKTYLPFLKKALEQH